MAVKYKSPVHKQHPTVVKPLLTSGQQCELMNLLTINLDDGEVSELTECYFKRNTNNPILVIVSICACVRYFETVLSIYFEP